jgi:hypothetical protein
MPALPFCPAAGPPGGSAAVLPESLQLLHSKATEVPQPGPGAAIKTLSAQIAQGMLFQAAQQRTTQQQHQQDIQAPEEQLLSPQQQQVCACVGRVSA